MIAAVGKQESGAHQKVAPSDWLFPPPHPRSQLSSLLVLLPWCHRPNRLDSSERRGWLYPSIAFQAPLRR